jgi:hypothetical protein
MDISFGCGCHLGASRVYGTTLRGEAQVGAGQSVDARLCTLTLIYDAISDKRAASLLMVNGAFPTIPPRHTGPALLK